MVSIVFCLFIFLTLYFIIININMNTDIAAMAVAIIGHWNSFRLSFIALYSNSVHPDPRIIPYSSDFVP